MILLFEIFAVVLWSIFAMMHALHMFQQNRYECKRYASWMSEKSFSFLLWKRVLLIAIIAILCILWVPKNWMLWIWLGCGFALWIYDFFLEKKATYILPLKWTGRVKRQTVVMILLMVLVSFGLLYPKNVVLLWVSIALVSILPWFLIYPMAWITEPIENAVKKHYQNDAKRILQEHTGLTIIGITGSYGKTSTKNIVQAVLSESKMSLMTPASYNTPMGITRTIRESLKPIHEVFVCEMGADHVGDISELMDFVHPSIGIVTSIGPQHLNTFGSLENIIHEKMQMIENLPTSGYGILNVDNPYIEKYSVKSSVPTITYGIHNSKAQVLAKEITYRPQGSTFVVSYQGEEHPFQTRLLGELNILNILSAICAARYLNIGWDQIQKAVKEMDYVEHRLQVKQMHGYTFLDDAFNANPEGSAMALQVLKGMPNKRWIVTPGMIDLGSKQESINYEFGKKMMGCVDEVILVGQKQTAPIYQGLKDVGMDLEHVTIIASEKEALTYVFQHAKPQDMILLENDLPDAFNQ